MISGKANKGFSLFELLVVLSISTIILTLAIPSQTFFITETNQAIASQQFLRAISLARSEAFLHSQTVSFCKSHDHLSCSGNWHDGQIIFVDENHNGVVKDKNHILAVFGSLKNNELHWRSSLNRDYLQILPDGLSDGENGTFWYCLKNAKNPVWAIRISQTGRARLEYPDQTGQLDDLKCY